MLVSIPRDNMQRKKVVINNWVQVELGSDLSDETSRIITWKKGSAVVAASCTSFRLILPFSSRFVHGSGRCLAETSSNEGHAGR